MQLSEKQQEAARLISGWYKSKDQVFYLAGYAGTGKTTIVNHVIKQLGDLKPVYCAFTGKAASVLKSKGNTPASTVHSLIYRIIEVEELQKNGTKKLVKKFALREEKFNEFQEFRDDDSEERGTPEQDLIFEVDLIVLDECSMISESLYKDLLSFDKKILVLGDPGQLPPIKGKTPFGMSDYTLTEIHRQAADSNILTLATMARKNQQIGFCEYDDAVCTKMDKFNEIYKPGYQVLCGTNKKRFGLNRIIRKDLFQKTDSYFPLEGEEIMCIKNSKENNLFNGQFIRCVTHALIDEKEANSINYNDLKRVKMTIESEYGFADVEADFRWFKASSEEDQKQLKILQKEQSEMTSNLLGFDFAHCITCHKSQGSQWDNVIIIDESKVFKLMKAKWLYTALTRAAKKVWLLK